MIWLFLIACVLIVIFVITLTLAIIFWQQKRMCLYDKRIVCHADWRCGDPSKPEADADYALRDLFLPYAQKCLFGASLTDCACDNLGYDPDATSINPYAPDDPRFATYTKASQNICDNAYYPPGTMD